MDFSVNSPILFVIVGAIVALVLAQSVFFLCGPGGARRSLA